MPDSPAELDRLERWMFEVITHPGGVAAGLASAQARRHLPVDPEALEAVVLPSRALSAAERMGIYADAYFWRLLDVMSEEYPTTREVVGAERFVSLCREFLTAHPSTSWTLARLSVGFPAFLAEDAAEVPHRALAADVARVERVLEDLFDAPRAEPVSLDDLLAVPRADWISARLETIPALTLLALDHPVNDLISAVRQGQPVALPGPGPSWLVVWRDDRQPWRKELSEAQHTLLSSLQRGRTLGQAIERCAALPEVSLETLLGALQPWFAEWAAEGFFAAVRT